MSRIGGTPTETKQEGATFGYVGKSFSDSTNINEGEEFWLDQSLSESYTIDGIRLDSWGYDEYGTDNDVSGDLTGIRVYDDQQETWIDVTTSVIDSGDLTPSYSTTLSAEYSIDPVIASKVSFRVKNTATTGYYIDISYLDVSLHNIAMPYHTHQL